MPDLNLDKYFLASIVESSHDSIITINLEMEITSWNRAAELLYGYTAEEAIGRLLTSLTLSKDFELLLEKIEKIKHSKQVEVFESERVGKDKAHMILEVVVSPVKDETGEIVGLSTIARDLTARRLAEKAMHDKDILHRLIIAQEDERSRISRDLHDELGQQLTALKFALQRVNGLSKDEASTGYIAEIAKIAENIDQSVDFLAWELRPALLKGVGLATAMENYVDQWSQHAGIETEILASSLKRVRFNPKVETNLYRIMQESLNNAHKHARAKRVEVILERRDKAVLLIISDNGRGFNVRNQSKSSKGLGLTGMKERAALIGASLEIESAAGRGTTVYVKVPAAQRRKRKALQTNPETDWHGEDDSKK
jgi:PAS domain S-box-containing protein